ncbi:MAG: hypothetical protein HFJ06_12800 [Lachnospiraceae bacterium]|nr:hypothetical protein [Lachnospiraceae bacterium]
MNKQDNKLALSVLAALIAGMALVYTLIMYRSILFAVVGTSVLFLITAFILTKNLIAFSSMKSKSINVHIKNGIDDISTQLEMMNSAQSRIGKANYIRAKQTAEILAQLENNYAESQMALYKNLSSLSNLQSKATRLMIKYDQNNTTQLVSTIKDMRNQLNETMIQGFDQIQAPNNTEIISILEDITAYLKSQPEGMDQELSMHLGNIAQELQNISNDVRQIEIPAPTVMQTIPVSNTEQDKSKASNEKFAEDMINDSLSGINTTETTDPIADVTVKDDIESFGEFREEPVDSLLEEIATDSIPAEELSDSATEEADVSATPTDTILNKDPNSMLSMDEIAALVAANTSEPEPEPKIKKGTFTVVDKTNSDTVKEPSAVSSTADNTQISGNNSDNDQNKSLSADEIAALFNAADPAPKKEKKKEAPAKTSSAKAEPSNNDTGKQLSADEIAALFAAAEPVPKKEEDIPQEKVAEPTLESIPTDPNKQLSADEIAALFSSMG